LNLDHSPPGASATTTFSSNAENASVFGVGTSAVPGASGPVPIFMSAVVATAGVAPLPLLLLPATRSGAAIACVTTTGVHATVPHRVSCAPLRAAQPRRRATRLHEQRPPARREHRAARRDARPRDGKGAATRAAHARGRRQSRRADAERHDWRLARADTARDAFRGGGSAARRWWCPQGASAQVRLSPLGATSPNKRRRASRKTCLTRRLAPAAAPPPRAWCAGRGPPRARGAAQRGAARPGAPPARTAPQRPPPASPRCS
jgi:hypothetical protein